MKTWIPTPLRVVLLLATSVAALSLLGCVSATGTNSKLLAALLAYCPDGTTKNLSVNVNSPWGSLQITGTNVVKTDNQITSETLDVVISSPVSPLLHFHSEGYSPTPGGAIIPTTIKLRP